MPRYRLAPQSERDIESFLEWSHEHFEESVRLRYEVLVNEVFWSRPTLTAQTAILVPKSQSRRGWILRMCEQPDRATGGTMTLDPRQHSFAWPEETTLTNVGGESMTIRPIAANLANLHQADENKLRVGQCYRYYTSGGAILTELEILYWFVGGHQVVFNLLGEFERLFDRMQASRLLYESVVQSFHDAGFHDLTIQVCLRWLIQDGYVALASEGENWFLDVVSGNKSRNKESKHDRISD
jgi:hypothetical protein